MSSDPNEVKPGSTNGARNRITASSNAILRVMAEYSGSRPLPSLSFKQTFTAFKYRNYRLWFFGQLVSLVGTWIQTVG